MRLPRSWAARALLCCRAEAAIRIIASVVALLCAFAARAWAHGGSGFQGPGSTVPPGLREPTDPAPPPPPATVPPHASVPCGCAELGCDVCTGAAVRSGENLAIRNQTAVVLERHGDFGRVLVTLEFRSKTGRTEAIAQISAWPFLAVTSARIEHGRVRLDAQPREAGAAGRAYVATVRGLDPRGGLDPLLLTRKGPGRFDVRAFPVSADRSTFVTIEGWAVVDVPPPTRPRAYRSREHVVVVDLGSSSAIDEPGVWFDAKSTRAFIALTPARAKRRFPGVLSTSVQASFASSIAQALRRSEGRWVALEQGVDALPRHDSVAPPTLSPPPP